MKGLDMAVDLTYDAQTPLCVIVAFLNRGEEITITHEGLPIARVVPVKQSVTRKERAAAIRRWRQTSKRLKLGGLKVRDLKHGQ